MFSKKEWQQNNKEKQKGYEKKHYLANREYILKRQKEYCQRNKEIIAEKRAIKLKEYREKNREKYRSRSVVYSRIRRGKLIRLPCEVCGTNDDVHAHHLSYKKVGRGAPVKISWLCRFHHFERHRLEGTLERTKTVVV